MKFRHIVLTSSLLLASGMSAGVISPMTQAMLNSYEELLAENPQDYLTYYERAVMYYKLSEYDKALTDLTKALQYTPTKDKDMRSREYSLVGDIYTELKDYNKAFANIDSALTLNPGDYALLYKRGNLQLYLNDAQGAFGTFSAMQRMRSRSQEAFYGMAKAAIMMGQEFQALEYIQQAENAAPGSELTYSRLGDLYMDLDRKEDAIRNYLRAFLIAEKGDRPLQALIKVSNTDFPLVSDVIDQQIKVVDDAMPLYLLKASLALESNNYAAAYEAYSTLLQDDTVQQPVLYAQLAKSSIAIGKLDDALAAATRAVKLDPSAQNYELLACAELLNGDVKNALKDSFQGDDVVTFAMAQRANGQYDEALTTLNSVIMENPENAQALLLRALLKSVNFNDLEGGKSDFIRLGNLTPTDETGMFYQGFGMTASGKKIDGDVVIVDMLDKYPTGRAAYLAALYYDKEGNTEKAQAMLSLAKERGFYVAYDLALKPLWLAK